MESPDSSGQELGQGDVALPSVRRYPVTSILVAINIVVFAGIRLAIELQPWGASLFKAMADWGPYTLTGQWWRLLSGQVLHHETAHLLGNILFLWILGKRAEQLFGRWTFLLLYLTCGVAGGLAGLVVHPEFISYGASAGVFGLAGSLISAYSLRGLQLSRRARWKLALLILWTALSFYPDARILNIDNAAHVGGLLAGLVLGALLSTAFASAAARRRQLFTAVAALLFIACVSIRYYNGYVVFLRSALQSESAGQPDAALRDLNVVLQKKPESLLGNVLIAQAYLQKADYAKAEAAARRVLAIDGNFDQAIFLLGIIEIRAGRCEEARKMAWNVLLKHRLRSEGLKETVLLLAPCDGEENLQLQEQPVESSQLPEAVKDR
jgi:membrane associated rhomboid family serine protease